jgi:hypothetical protein
MTTTVRPDRLELEPEMDIPRRMGLDDIATFDESVKATLSPSRQEQGGAMF